MLVKKLLEEFLRGLITASELEHKLRIYFHGGNPGSEANKIFLKKYAAQCFYGDDFKRILAVINKLGKTEKEAQR